MGHLGYITLTDIIVTMAALEMTLQTLGVTVELGVGVKAVQQVILQGEE